MVAFVTVGMSGMVPRKAPRLLDAINAQYAKNVDLTAGTLRPLADLLQVGAGLLTKTGPIKALYRFSQDEPTDTQYWFHWAVDADVVRGPIAGDTAERTYFTLTGSAPQYTYSPLATAGAGIAYPYGAYQLGLPAPAITWAITVSDKTFSSITHTTTTAHATTSAPHGLASGATIVVSGATAAVYNGTFTIAVTGASTFDYTMASDPGANATVAGGYTWGGTVESRVYVVTYVSPLGEEGPPSVANSLISVTPGQTVLLAPTGGFPAAPAGPYNMAGGKLRLYRSASGTANATLRYVADLTLGQANYTDAVSALSLGETIPSLTWIAPPSDAFNLIDLGNGMHAVISGKQVCLCVPYQMHAYPVANRYSFSINPTAIASFGQNIVVLSKGTPRLLSGVDPGAMSDNPIKLGLPCSSARSVVEIDGGVMWSSPEGLAFVGPSGPALATEAVLTRKEWAAYAPASIRGYRWRNSYIGFYDTGTAQGGFLFDTRSGEFYELDFYATGGYTDPRNGELYLAIGTQVMKFAGASTKRTLLFRSKAFVAPEPINMAYAKVEAATYPVNFRIYADGVQRGGTLAVTRNRPFALPKGYLATEFYYEVDGANEIKAVTLAETVNDLSQTVE